MKKSIIGLVCALFCISVIFAPVSAFAAEEKCSLALTYSKEHEIFSDVEIKIYRIAGKDLEMLPSYSVYPVELGNVSTQAEWNDIATTLRGFIESDDLEPYAVQTTNESGVVVFTDLEVGLYLVSEVTVEKEDKLYSFSNFMINLPAYEDGAELYDVSAKPKPAVSEVEKGEKTYTVLKLWKDQGTDVRPTEISVDILKNGTVEETVTLNSENNWSYTFKSKDHDSRWTVVEKNVPTGYSVTVSEKGTTFVVVNTYFSDGDNEQVSPHEGNSNAPQTGETLPLKLFIIIFCISGMIVLVFGIGVRRKTNEKHR